jgi:hypothetical protein
MKTPDRNIRPNNTTGYRGVSPLRGRFQAQITFDWKNIYLGVFTDPRKAARAYDRAAKKYFGDAARTNF